MTRVLGMGLFLAAVACEPSSLSDLPACEGWRPGDVVITEVLPDPEGTDTGREWLELYNPGRAAVDLRGLMLYAARADGAQERAYFFETSVPVEPRGHVVLGDVRTGTPAPPVDHAYGDALGALANTGGRLGLRCGEVVVDEVHYAKARSGVSRIFDGQRVPDAVDNDVPEHWCDSPASAEGGLRMSPGAENPPCPPGAAPDAGLSGTCLSPRTGETRSRVPPRPGDLLLTEVMADPRTVPDAQGEWVEVYALRDVDLNGVTLANEGTGRTVLDAPPRCLEMRAGTHAVLAREEHPARNGGLPSVLALFSFGVSNTAGFHLLRLSLEGQVLDEVSWTRASVAGVSLQLDPRHRTVPRAAPEVGWCLAPESARYGPGVGERGTPGGENRPCGP
ncbi:lamin tail domain-containing protein [Archangium primigenium]|uniref:lamin tail domain-containing protein n=1 Tax=[Archangium] primigenium TaxID=2792470 RepID=UPI001EF7E4F2|nr:lamin tail domain-containing protein [Archangium primigenium]